MRVPAAVLILVCVRLLSTDLALSQPPTAQAKPSLAARIEVDEHEHCFTVRFFLKNETDQDTEVTYGRGGEGMSVVPTFYLNVERNIIISPPTYLGGASRALQPNVIPIPAGKEILYGTFTMGYPPSLKDRVEELYATIHFEKRTPTLTTTQTPMTKPARLKIPAQKPGSAGAIVATDDSPQAPDRPGEWVNSDNDDLSLRLRVKSARIATHDGIFVIAEIRNNRPAPVTILRPFGDHYFAEGVQIKIWDEQGQVKYTGPTADYDLTAEAFVTLDANEIVTDTLELPVLHFAGTYKAGTYTLRYDYAYSGTWDKKVASEGVVGIWHGAMCSREIQLQKK